MISVREAIKLVLKHSHSLLEKETLTIDRCLNRNLASSVKITFQLSDNPLWMAMHFV